MKTKRLTVAQKKAAHENAKIIYACIETAAGIFLGILMGAFFRILGEETRSHVIGYVIFGMCTMSIQLYFQEKKYPYAFMIGLFIGAILWCYIFLDPVGHCTISHFLSRS